MRKGSRRQDVEQSIQFASTSDLQQHRREPQRLVGSLTEAKFLEPCSATRDGRCELRACVRPEHGTPSQSIHYAILKVQNLNIWRPPPPIVASRAERLTPSPTDGEAAVGAVRVGIAVAVQFGQEFRKRARLRSSCEDVTIRFEEILYQGTASAGARLEQRCTILPKV